MLDTRVHSIKIQEGLLPFCFATLQLPLHECRFCIHVLNCVQFSRISSPCLTMDLIRIWRFQDSSYLASSVWSGLVVFRNIHLPSLLLSQEALDSMSLEVRYVMVGLTFERSRRCLAARSRKYFVYHRLLSGRMGLPILSSRSGVSEAL